MERRSSPEFYVKSKGWNALLSPNRYSTEIFRTAFRYDGEILEFGYPANDIFYHRDRYNQVRRNIRAKLGIHDENTPVYLYAPTWRDGKHLGNYMFKFDLLLNIDEFIEHAPKDAILLIRSHHMSYSTEELKGLTGRVKNVSEWDDAIELMCASDVLITDYSSIVFDWYCSRKPVIYYVPDYDEYVHNLRGAYFDLNEVNAGEICRTQDELFKILKKVVKKKPVFHKDFYNKFCYLHDGKSADKVIDYLLLK
jgi:CDP-glycerol glycerophosphotransferase